MLANIRHKGEAWQLVSGLILNTLPPPKCQGLVVKLGFFQVRRALGCGASSASSPGFICTNRRAAARLSFHTGEGAGGCSLSACQSIAERQYFMLLWQI